MIKLLHWSLLCVTVYLFITISGEPHWTVHVIKGICLAVWIICREIAEEKEKKLIKRIEELEKLHKEKE